MCLSIGSIFFFKQKTAHDMRISDWSSAVGASEELADAVLAGSCALTAGTVPAATSAAMPQLQTLLIPVLLICPLLSGPKLKIGRASCRERVCKYVEITVGDVS